jgi:hypothetical protein
MPRDGHILTASKRGTLGLGLSLGKFMRKFDLAAAALAGALLLPLAADAGTLIPVVPFTNSTLTFAYGINDNGLIAGIYQRSDASQHGFVGTISGDQYSSFDFGAGGVTYAFSLSDEGYITGSDAHLTQGCTVQGCQWRRQPGGEPDQILHGSAGVDGVAGQIVKKQKFVGDYWTTDNDTFVSHGYYGKGAVYVKDLVLPFDTARTHPRGYDKAGDVVGYYTDTANHDQPGFILHKGTVTSVTFPDADAVLTMFEGLNDKGEIVGGWENGNDDAGQAFLYNSTRNAFKAIKIPGSALAIARQINNAGLVTIISDVGSFIYCSKKQTCPAARGAVEIPEGAWIPARGVHWAACHRGCTGPARRAGRVDAAGLHAAMARDPGMEPDLRLPVRR